MKNKKNRLTRLRLLLIIGVVFIIWLLIRIVIGIKQNANALNEYLPSTYSITSEDSSLLSKNNQSKIEVVETKNSKTRSSIPILLYDKNYHILTYKIDLVKNDLLSNLITLSYNNTNVSAGYSYLTIQKAIIYRFRYIAGNVKPASHIYLTLAGDSIKTVAKNDSIISIHLKCKNVSIKYGENNPVDILITGEEKPLGRTTIVPMDILFLKRKGNIYLLIMTPKSSELPIPVNLLYDIVTKNSSPQ